MGCVQMGPKWADKDACYADLRAAGYYWNLTEEGLTATDVDMLASGLADPEVPPPVLPPRQSAY
jgi:hypothetical protein